MSDYKTFLDATQQSIMGTGSSMQYVGVQLETLSKKYDSLKQHLVGLSVATGEGGLSSTLKSVVDSLTTLVSGFEHIDGSTITWTASIALLAMGFGKFVKALEVASEAEKGFATITATVDALTGNWGNLLAAIAVGGLTTYAFSAGKAAEAQEKLNSAMDEAVKTAPQIADQYVRRAQFLRDTLNDIKLIQQQLNSDEAKSNPQRRQQLEDDLKYAQQAMLKMAGSDYASNIKNSNFSDLSVENTAKSLELQANKAKSMIEMGQGLDVTLQSLTERYVQLKKSMDDGSLSDIDKAKNLNDLHGVTNQLTEILPSLKVGYDKNGEAVLVFDNAIKNNTTSMKTYYDMLDKTKSVNLATQIDEQTKALEKAKKALDDKKAQLAMGAEVDDPFNIGGNGKNDSNLTRLDPEKLKTLRGEVDQLSQSYQKEADKLNTLKASQKDASQTTNEYTQEIKNAYLGHAELGKIIGGQVDANEKQVSLTKQQTANLKVLNQAEYELNKNGELSSETTQKLTKINGDYTDAIGKGKDAVLEMIKTQKQEQTTSIDGEIQKTKNLLDQVQARIDLHILEAKAIKQVADMEAEIANSKTDNAMTAQEEKDLTNKINMFQKQPLSADAQNNLEDLKKQAENLTSSLGGLNATKENYLKNDKLEADNAKKATTAINDETQAYKNEEDHLQKLYEIKMKNNQADIDNTQYLMSQVKKGSEDHIKLIQQEIDLKTKRIALLEEERKREQAVASVTSTSSSDSSSSSSSYTGKYSDIINKASSKYNVPTELIAAIIQQESDWNPSSHSSANAMGLMQLTPDSFHDYGKGNVWNPVDNIMAGTHEISTYLKQFGDLKLALAAYNAGPGNVRKYGGIPPFKETQDYVPKVMNNMQKYSGDISVVDKYNKSLATYTKVSDDAATKSADFNDQIAKLQQEIANLNWDKVTAKLQGFEDASKQMDQQISISKSVAEQYNQSSQQYRDETQKQIPLLIQKENLAHKEADYIREAQKLYAKNSEQYAELDDKLRSVTQSYWDNFNAIHAVQQALEDSKLAQFDESINKLNTQLSHSKDVMSMLQVGSDAYNTELTNQMSLEQQISPQLKQKETELRSFISTLKEGTTEYETYTKQLNDTISAEDQAQKSLYDMKSSLADDIINIYKSYYEDQKTVALASIQSQMDAEDARHKRITDNLDAEQKKFEDTINAKLKLIDQASSAQDYQDQLNQAQSDAQDLQNQINVLTPDNSYEAQSKRTDLQKQLAQKQNDIAKLQLNHNTDLRKQNLQNQLDAYKSDIDAKKKVEDDKYNATKASLDKQKTATEQMYTNLENDDRKFMKIRNDIIAGHFDAVKGDLSSFSTYLGANMKTIGTSISQNLIDKIQQAMALIKQVQGASISASSTGGASSSNSTLDMLGQKYNEAMAKGDTASASFYHQAANDYRQQNGMQTYYDSNTDKSSSNHSSSSTSVPSWSSSQVQAARQAAIDAGGVTASSSKIPGFAVGGRVEKKTLAWVGEDEPETIIPDSFFKNQDGFTVGLNKIDTSKFNLSNILKTVDIVRNFASNIKLPDLSKLNLNPASANSSGGTYQLNVNIDKFSGTQSDYSTLLDKLDSGMRKLGFKPNR